MSYYTSIIVLSWLALGVLCILVRENDRMSKADKRVFYLTYVLLALAALEEWLGVQLNGNPAFPAWLLKHIKCADYILTPAAGGMLIFQLPDRSIWRRLMKVLLAVNALFQILSLFTGWMLTIDGQNHYVHGPLYGLYIAIYFLVTALIVMECIRYGRRFRRQNKVSLYAIVILIISGVVMQEFMGGEHRTAYIALTLGMAMMFIHHAEFSQLAADDHMQEQALQMRTDVMTGALNRFAYTRVLGKIRNMSRIPKKLTVFSIDVNGLKTVNDTMGHEAGDELIRGAAACIISAVGDLGSCFRTGGDEFVVIAGMNQEEISATKERLKRITSVWRGKLVSSLHLAVGSACAAEHPDVDAEKLVSIADQEMYRDKSAYYRAAGIDRRRSNRQTDS